MIEAMPKNVSDLPPAESNTVGDRRYATTTNPQSNLPPAGSRSVTLGDRRYELEQSDLGLHVF